MRKPKASRTFVSITTLPVLVSLAAFLLPAVKALAGTPAGATSQSTAADRKKVELTVYRDFAVVKETRALQILAAGVGTLRFADVPKRIDRDSVAALSADGGLRVVEQEFLLDTMSQQSLLKKYLGKPVQIIDRMENGRARKKDATLLSVENGEIYQVGDSIELGRYGGVVLPAVPEDLVRSPTLVWEIDSRRAGEHEAEVSYVVEGFRWNADYRALLDQDEKMATVSAWVTVENASGADFSGAMLAVVAGDVKRRQERNDETRTYALMSAYSAVSSSGRASPANEASLLEHRRYSFERPITLADGSSKQIAFLEDLRLPVRKRFELRRPEGTGESVRDVARRRGVQTLLDLVNEPSTEGGTDLPRGAVSVFAGATGGSAGFAGQDVIPHTPRGETATLALGAASGIVAIETQTFFQQRGMRDSEAGYRVEFRNHTDAEVVVEVRDEMPREWNLVESSLAVVPVDARTLGFDVKVPARGEARLDYRVRLL